MSEQQTQAPRGRSKGASQEKTTARDMFAASALQGLLSGSGASRQHFRETVARAFEVADAMMIARKGGAADEP